jgi:hypothetical protein
VCLGAGHFPIVAWSIAKDVTSDGCAFAKEIVDEQWPDERVEEMMRVEGPAIASVASRPEAR